MLHSDDGPSGLSKVLIFLFEAVDKIDVSAGRTPSQLSYNKS
jgi:hypothetical protein